MRTIQRALYVLLLVAAPAAFAAEGIAFITNIKGEAVLDGGSRPTVLTELAKGQKLVLGKESLVSVMYVTSGKEYVLRGPGEYLVKDTEIGAANGMPPVTRTTEWRPTNKVLVQVAQTSAASVRMRSAAPAKPEPAARLLFPTQGKVSSLQPTFRWAAPDAKGAADFTLTAVGEDKPAAVAKVGGTSHRTAAKLKPDTDYAWAISVGGQEIGTGRFRTLGAEAIQKVEQRRPSEKAEFSDRLMHALLLQEMGAVQEAREAWARLSQERADLPELAGLAR